MTRKEHHGDERIIDSQRSATDSSSKSAAHSMRPSCQGPPTWGSRNHLLIYLEVIQDIEAGQELHLASYNLLLAHESSSHQRNGALGSFESAGW
ncbi:hypothetical protein CDAR_39771 [Caerostris darwini]|uniref:Uncharacterized protein n=1 Tax=Caerostris darwini TaxID=1538125 RepID=A0AAV4U6J4_9ARAC|nr:hypothetical protein CDAR_39771 [Caerostris darwini]